MKIPRSNADRVVPPFPRKGEAVPATSDALLGSGVIHPESHHLAGTESKSYHPRIVVGDAVWRTDFCRGALAGTA